MSSPNISPDPPSSEQPGTASNPLRKKHFKPSIQSLSLTQPPVQRSQRLVLLLHVPRYNKAGPAIGDIVGDIVGAIVGEGVGSDVVE